LNEKEHSGNIPNLLRKFRNGNIIKPHDLFAHQEAWQVVGGLDLNSCGIDLNPLTPSPKREGGKGFTIIVG
jgi:hypothetical protein